MGGLFRACAPARWPLAQVLKTKAPSEARAAEFGTERQKFEGTCNSIVDARAKSAVVDLQGFAPVSSSGLRSCLLFTDLLSFYPPAEETRGELNRVRNGAAGGGRGGRMGALAPTSSCGQVWFGGVALVTEPCVYPDPNSI